MSEIIIKNVKKIYDNKVTAVHDFNLEIKDKEFIVFVGPSGCGKSTTLRMVAGLEEISEGTVEIDGKIVNDLPPKDRNIAMVFQNYALYPHLSVFDNIAFPLRLMKQEFPVQLTDKERVKLEAKKAKLEAKIAKLGANHPRVPELTREVNNIKAMLDNGYKVEYKKMDNQEIYNRVTSVAETLGITEYLARKPRALSGGQRQRVAIGRAMVRDSKVLLMDEPLSNLDAKLRNQMRAEIILLRKKIDATFIYVTHDQTEAMTLGDRIVIMKDGFVQQVGTPQQVFNSPANLFVAGFIGAPQMNFFHEAKLTKEGDKYFVEVKGSKFEVDGVNGKLLNEHKVASCDVVLGVRPEHMLFSAKPSKNALECELIVSEMMGSELHLHLLCADGSQLVVRVPTVNLSEEEMIAATVPGTKSYISFEGKVMHLFNKNTGTSLLHPEFEYVVNEEGVAKESTDEQIKDMQGE